jgi:hypothetical protein
MMTFLHKSKFPMINIAIIITITNQIVSCYGQTFLFLEHSLSRLRDNSIDHMFYTQSGFRYFDDLQTQGSRLRTTLLKKLSCGARLCFLVGQQRSPNCFVILKSWFMSPAYFYHVVIYENVNIVFIGIYNKHVSHPLSILKVIFLKSN